MCFYEQNHCMVHSITFSSIGFLFEENCLAGDELILCCVFEGGKEEDIVTRHVNP
jgi:hypothetical protein